MAFSGALKFLVLNVLSENSLTGNQILKNIDEKIGWKVSCGSIYPLLSELCKSSLIEFTKDKSQKKYIITKKGRRFLEDTSKKKKEILKKILEGLNLLKLLESDKEQIEELKEKIKIDSLSYLLIHDSLFELRSVLFKVNLEKHNQKVVKILNETKERLEKLK